MVVGLPVVDVRGMVDGDTGRTTVPFWPDPDAFGNAFVRGLGALRRRPRRGLLPWLGEGHFVDARRGVRFCADAVPVDGKARSSLRPVYRRFYSDGTVGRLETAFRVNSSRIRPGTRLEDLLSDAARTEVRSPRAGATPLLRFGDELAECLLLATTSARRRPVDVPNWWIRAGAPVVVAELTGHEAALLDAALSQAAATQHPPLAERQPVAVSQRWRQLEGARVSTWSLATADWRTPEALRELRVHALRCHAEVEALRAVLRLCHRGRLDAATSSSLREFLDQKSSFFLRRQFDRFPHRALLERVLDGIANGYEEELLAVDKLIGALRPGLAGKLADVSKVLAEASVLSAESVFVVGQGGIVTMNDNSTEISGGTVGAVQGGTGNTQYVGGVRQTVSFGTDLTDLVQQLVDTVQQVRTELPDDVAVEGQDLAETVKSEAEKPEPDTGKLSRALGRVKEWAEAVGDAAAPVIKTVAAIAALLP